MKRLMLILIILAIATSTYSESLSDWWESLSKEERIEVLQDYINIKNAEDIGIDEIEIEVRVEGQHVIIIFIYPEGQDFYLINIADALQYQLTFEEMKIENALPNPWISRGVSFSLGVLLTSILFAIFK